MSSIRHETFIRCVADKFTSISGRPADSISAMTQAVERRLADIRDQNKAMQIKCAQVKSQTAIVHRMNEVTAVGLERYRGLEEELGALHDEFLRTRVRNEGLMRQLQEFTIHQRVLEVSRIDEETNDKARKEKRNQLKRTITDLERKIVTICNKMGHKENTKKSTSKLPKSQKSNPVINKTDVPDLEFTIEKEKVKLYKTLVEKNSLHSELSQLRNVNIDLEKELEVTQKLAIWRQTVIKNSRRLYCRLSELGAVVMDQPADQQQNISEIRNDESLEKIQEVMSREEIDTLQTLASCQLDAEDLYYEPQILLKDLKDTSEDDELKYKGYEGHRRKDSAPLELIEMQVHFSMPSYDEITPSNSSRDEIPGFDTKAQSLEEKTGNKALIPLVPDYYESCESRALSLNDQD